ncbi:HdeD family acid-resistance protein [Allobaculum mucilyticum]|uniref:HdeD family acid-resistance protein n=2 Tax=Allobaculum mucilyticum TaxID=2834459 RepID=UPI001E41EC8D|nr:DUF308 domain-containing protein [Allobaculum mucilyticum]
MNSNSENMVTDMIAEKASCSVDSHSRQSSQSGGRQLPDNKSRKNRRKGAVSAMTIQEKFEAVLAALFTLSGLVFLLYPRISADAILIGAALMASASGLLLLWQAVRHRHLMDFLKAAGTFLLTGFFWSFRAVGVRFVCLVFSLYMLFTAVILAIEAFMDLHEKSKTGWAILVVAAGDLALSLFGFFFYKRDPALLSRLTGIYLIWQGVQMIVEIFAFRHHRGSRAWAIRYISSLPVYLVAAAPSLILRFLYKRNMDQAAFTSREPKNSEPVNLRVFVHSGLKGEQQFGHMTIAYKGVMFSYGNYDAAQEKLFRTFGPGILFTVPAEIYVNNCCVYEGSTLFEYGLHIDREQEEKLESLLRSIFAGTYRWYSPLFEKLPDHERFQKYEKDYASRLEYRTGAKFYKFHTGVWKTYWVFGRNCSLFASELLHAIDSKVVIPKGINTPGEYFDYFEQALQDPSSNVICQSYHTASRPDTLYPVAL